MTFNEAIALQPNWVQIWVNILLLGAFIMPLTLFIWRQTRLTALLTLTASLLAALSINYLYSKLGYVKLLGLPHILFWVPLLGYQLRQYRRPDMPVWPRRILAFIMATIVTSLAFDIVDSVHYLLGDRTPMAGTAPTAP